MTLLARMNWEAVTAIGTVFTGIVIFITVILGRHQIDQLRRATRREGITRIFEEMDSSAAIVQIRQRKLATQLERFLAPIRSRN